MWIRLVLLLVGGLLVIDGLVLFLLLKINFGTVVPFIIGVIFLIHALYWQRIRQYLRRHQRLTLVWRSLWGMFIVWLMSFAAFLFILHRQVQASQSVPQVRAILVLGAGVVNGQPTKALANRLDSAVPLILANPQSVVITSGGVGFGEQVSEATIMANYLHDKHHIPLQRIQTENQSTSTEKNLALSQAILAKHAVQTDELIAIVTNDFHTVRAKAIAEKQGYRNVLMVASQTPWSIRFNALFREYFAFVSGWLLDEY